VRWVLLVVLLGATLYVVLPELAGARKSLSDLGHLDIAYVILGVGLEAGALGAYAQLTHTVLPPGAVRRPRLLRINMSSLAVSHVVPGGTAPATGLSYRLLTESGVAGPDAAFGLAIQGAGSAVVLNALLGLALVVSIFVHGYNPLYGVAAGIGALLMASFGAVVYLLLRNRPRPAEFIRRLAARIPFVDEDAAAHALTRIVERLRSLLSDRPLLVRAIGWAAANWLLDAASLWVFIAAFHTLISPIDLLVAYGLANVLAVIPITPSGLGVIEGVLIPTLAGFGVAKEKAVLAVVGYRLVNFWLPIPIGGLCYLSLRLGARRSAAAAGPQASSRRPPAPGPGPP